MSEKAASPDPKESKIFRAVHGYHLEAEWAKRNRMQMNRENFDCYHGRQDYSHKKPGQSKEFLAKQAGAVEQITSFVQQGLIDVGTWYRIDTEPGISAPLIEPHEMQKLLSRQLKYNRPPQFIADALKSGLLGALMIVKVGGKHVDKKKFRTEIVPGSAMKKKLIKQVKKCWRLELSIVRQENWFPDPTCKGLYEQEMVELDYHELCALGEQDPKQFDREVIEKLSPNPGYMDSSKKATETGQNQQVSSIRKMIRFIEHWGTICDPDTGEVLHENALCRVTLEGQVITAPMENPLWHGESPYVVSPIIRVPGSVWHKALMDAPTQHNKALNELYNLMLDGGLMSVFGIKQCREDWLEDPSQISNGIAPGTTLMVNSSCPAGEKVLERVDTGTLEGREAFEMFQITDREFQASALVNDTRMGNLPQRAVKATEIVASNNSITGIFNGITKVVEECFIARILEKAWQLMAQNMNDLDQDEVKALLGKDRAIFLSTIAPEDRFAATALGRNYVVFGLSTTLNKIQDFRKISTFLQVVGATPVFIQEFQRRYSVTKLLSEVVKALDIDEEKIKADEGELQERQQEQAIIQRHLEREAAKGGDQASQIPHQANTPEETGMEPPRAALNVGMTNPGAA